MDRSVSQLLTVEDLAELLGLSPKAVYQARYKGQMPPATQWGGRGIRWRREVVEAWLERRTENGEPGL